TRPADRGKPGRCACSVPRQIPPDRCKTSSSASLVGRELQDRSLQCSSFLRNFSHNGHKGHKDNSEESSSSNCPLISRLIPFFRCASPKLIKRPSLRLLMRNCVKTCLACNADTHSADLSSTMTLELTSKSER